MLSYKGYLGIVEFDEENNSFFGKVLGIRQLVSFEAENALELKQSFYDAIDDYLLFCEENNIIPDKPYEGHLDITISPNLHRAVVENAQRRNLSINEMIGEALKNYLEL